MIRFNFFIKLLVIIALILTLAWVSVHAEQQGDFTYSLAGDEATITGYSGSDTIISIPNVVGGSGEYSVVSIGAEAFKDLNTITKIIVPNGVTTIGIDAFQNSNSELIIECVDWNVAVMEYALAHSIACEADNITITKEGELARKGSGYYNGSDSNLTIPVGTKSIGNNAFYGGNFTAVSLPDTLTTLHYGAFYKTALVSVTIPEGVISIAADAFGYCFKLTSIDIPASVTSIGDNVFRICSSLTNIVVDEANPNYSAENGKLLSKDKTELLQFPSVSGVFSVPSGVTSVGLSCFYQNNNITGLIASEANSLKNSAFSSCKNISSIYLGNSVTSIANSAFYYNQNLTDLTIVNDTINIASYSFSSTNSITNVWCNADSNAAEVFPTQAKRPLTILNAPARLAINDSVTLAYEENETFTNLNSYIASDISWSSSDPGLATVSATGEVTGRALGTVTITASRADGLRDSLELDIVNPVKITAIDPDTGIWNDDFLTNSTSFDISGVTRPNTGVELFLSTSRGLVANDPPITATADENGLFSFGVIADQSFGGFENSSAMFVAKVTISDTEYSSPERQVTVDTTSPTWNISLSSNDVHNPFQPVILSYNEPVCLASGNEYYELSPEFLNQRAQNSDISDDIFDIDLQNKGPFGFTKVKDLQVGYEATSDRTSFTITPAYSLFPLSTISPARYQVNISEVCDYAGNVRLGFGSHFTFEEPVELTSVVSLQTNLDHLGLSLNQEGHNVGLNFPEFDLTQAETIAKLEQLKGNYSVYQNSLIESDGTDYSNYASVALRVWADAEYDNFFISEDYHLRDWQKKGSITVFGGTDTDVGKSYLDIYVRIAYKEDDVRSKTAEQNEYTIVFEKDNGASYYAVSFTLTMNHDEIAPSNNYQMFLPVINLSNQASYSFTVTGAEQGALCYYLISDTDDNTVDIEGEILEDESGNRIVEGLNLRSLAEGEITIVTWLKDSAGNISKEVSQVIEKDLTKPTADITTTLISPTYAKVIPVNIEFSEKVTGLSLESLVVGNGVISHVDGSNQSYTIYVVPTELSQEQEITVGIPADSYQDLAGNPNLASDSLTITYLPNNEPQIVKDINNITDAGVGNTISFNLSEHFSDADGDQLTYSVCSFNENDHGSKGISEDQSCEDSIGELNGTIWSFTPTDDDLGNSYIVRFSATDNKAEPITITFTINVPEEINLDITVKNVTTYGGSDGSISVNVIGDLEGYYEYSKDGGKNWQEESIFSNLVAGTYSIRVRDKNYVQSGINSVTVTQPAKVSNNSTNAKPKVKHEVTIALEKAPKNEQGIIEAKIEQQELNYQGAYSQNIPKTFFKGDKKVLEIKTPVATISVPSNMFSADINGRIDLVVEELDREKLSPEVRALVGDKKLIDVNIELNRKHQSWSNSDVEVEIAIPYVPTLEEKANKNYRDSVIAYYLSSNGKIIPITLCEYDEEKGAVVFRTNHFSKFGIMVVSKLFKDIENIDWAHKAIASLTARGVIKGSSPTTFSPNAQTTRADMVIFINRFFGLSGEVSNNYVDVVNGTYYYNEIAVAKQLGILNKIATDSFRPEEPISREDMMVLLKSALDYSNQSSKLTKESGKALSDFADNHLVAEYAQESIDYLISKTIVGGYNNKISPRKSTTRVDVIAILYKLLLALQN